jgi:hypothetical protein
VSFMDKEIEKILEDIEQFFLTVSDAELKY